MQLSLTETEGTDYRVRMRSGSSGIAIMAIHGGGIEPGTTEIAEAIAGACHSFYTFSGLKKKGNKSLHITSSSFDEPRGLGIAASAFAVLSIHGCGDAADLIYLGGKNSELTSAIKRSLSNSGFAAGYSVRFPGMNPSNICNRCRCGAGVQLEICLGLRKRMFEYLDRSKRLKPTEVFHIFVDSIKSALNGFRIFDAN